MNRAEDFTKRWRANLAAITVASTLIGYPAFGLLSSILGLSTEDQRLSILSWVITAILSFALFSLNAATSRMRLPNFLLVLFLACYSARLGYDYLYEFKEEAGYALGFLAISSVLPSVAIMSLRGDDWDEGKAGVAITLVGAVVVALALIAGVFGFADISQQELDYLAQEGRLGFGRLNPIYLGHAATTTALVAIHMLVNGRARGILRLWLVGLTAAALFVLYLTQSRGPMIAFAGGLAMMMIFWGRGRGIALAGFAGIAVVSLLAVYDLDRLLAGTRLGGSSVDVTTWYRLALYEEAWDAFLASPIYGYSYDLPLSREWPHNLALEVLMALGVLGGALLLILVVLSLIRSLRILASGGGIAALIFVQYFIGAQFSGSIWGNHGLWMGMAMALSMLGAQNVRPAGSGRPRPFRGILQEARSAP